MELRPGSSGRTGLILDAYFSATKIAWILDHVPAPDAGLRLENQPSAPWIHGWCGNFTGGQNNITDATNASRTLLFNLHTGSGTGNC